MPSPNFLLYGIAGVYNYGCEAIVRGTEILLREQWPNCTVHYASLRPTDDQARLSGVRMEIIPRKRVARWSPTNVARKLADLAGLHWVPPSDCAEVVGNYDAVLSIGGDLYRTGPRGSYNAQLVRFGESVIAARKPFVIWGASVGPFDSEPARSVCATHLSHADLITSREPESTEYLASLGLIHNTIVCADPAFAVPRYPRATSPHPRIAVNLSPLSVRARVGSSSLERVALRQASAIAEIISACDTDLLLVPHVDCAFNQYDDDWSYLEMVRKALPPQVARRTSILPRGLGFLGTRRVLASCDLAIAARMHCAINALGTGTPAILLAYSQKSVGMARTVYGHSDFLIPIDAIGTPWARDRIVTTFARRNEIQAELETNLKRFQAESRVAVVALRDMLARQPRHSGLPTS